MKKAKKLLVTLLVLTFVLSSFSVGFAADAEKLPTEVVRAQALGILKGDDQGNLNLDKPITRAEALALIIRISGLDKSADLMKGQTQFADANAAPGLQWATGYINLGVGQKIVNGYPDGTFQGNKEVTYAEMAKMLLYAMNYGVTVEGAPWPAGVMGKADDLDIFKKVNALPNVPALRGDVVKMIDNSLEIKHLVQEGYGDLKTYKEGDKTFLSKMNVEEVSEVIVTAIPRTDSKLKDNEIKLGSKKYKVLADVNYEELFGQEVTVFLNDDDEIISVEIDSDFYYDALKDITDKKIKLVDAGEKYDFAEEVTVYINAESKEIANLKGNLYDYAKVVLNEDGEVAFVDAYTWDDFLVVEEAEDDVLYAYGEEIDLEDFTIVKDGKAISADDLKEGDIFFYNTKAEFAEVYNEEVAGKIGKVFTDKMVVDGEDYEYAGSKYLDDNKLKAFKDEIADEMREEGEAVALFLDRAGNLVYVIGDRGVVAKSTVVGYLYEPLKVYENRGVQYLAIDMINEEGKKVSYDVKCSSLDLAAGKEETNVLTKSGGIYSLAAATDKVLIKLKVDADGDVVEVWKAAASTSFNQKAFAADYKTDAKYIEDYRVKSGTVVFLVEDFLAAGGDKDDIKVVKWADIKDFEKIYKGNTPNSAVYFDDKGYATYIVAVGTDVEDEKDSVKAIITDISKVKGKDERRIVAFVNGEEKTYYSKDDAAVKTKMDAIDVSTSYAVRELKVNKTTGLVVDVATVTSTTVTVTSRSVADKKINNYRLVDEAYVYDATDKTDLEKITLRDIAVGDKVVLVFDKSGTNFVKYVILDEEATDVTPVADYSIKTFTSSELTVSGFVYDDEKAENNKFFVKVTGGASDAYGTATISSGAGVQDATFTGVSVTAGKVYTVELYLQSKPEDVIATWKKFVAQ